MRPLYRLAPLVLLLLVTAGCQALHPVGSSQTGTVTHVVIMWLNDPSDETARHEVLAAGHELETISGVLSVAGGRPMRSDRPEVDTSYDVAIVVTLRDEAALRSYLTDPKHVELKKNVLERYVRKFQIYDLVGE